MRYIKTLKINLIIALLIITQNLFSEKLFITPEFPDKEVIVYRTFHKGVTNIEILKKVLSKTNIKGKIYYKIYTHSTEGFKRIELLNQDLVTVKFLQIRNSLIERKFNIIDNKIHLIKPVKKTIKIDEPVYDIKSLQYVLRGYPWGKKFIRFNVMLENGKIVKLRATNLGTYKIKIPAGEFLAYKILIEPENNFVRVFYKTKTYLYFHKKPYFSYLKYEDTEGNVDEVIKIEHF